MIRYDNIHNSSGVLLISLLIMIMIIIMLLSLKKKEMYI